MTYWIEFNASGCWEADDNCNVLVASVFRWRDPNTNTALRIKGASG